MTPAFPIEITRHFERVFKKLVKVHPELPGHYAEAITILETDPYNRSRGHPIKKLQGVPAGDGQYRIRAGRFRFRYDVEGRVVSISKSAPCVKTPTDERSPRPECWELLIFPETTTTVPGGL